MPLSDFASLLSDLATAFGEPVQWRGGEFVGRFRIDPFTVNLPVTDSTQGLNVTETWLYTEIRQIPRDQEARLPDINDELIIRDWRWEIVEVGDDDLGERQFRLLRREPAPPQQWVHWDRPPVTPEGTRWDLPPGRPQETLWPLGPLSRPGATPPQPPYVRALGGRPTRRDDIERAYAAVAPRYDPATPLTHMYPAIRREITGRETPSKGLADKTLAKILGELRRKPR